MMSPRHAATHLSRGVPVRYLGEDIELRPGETTGQAYARKMANKPKQLATPVAKPAPVVDSQLADLQSRSNTAKTRKGIRLGQGGFNVFKPNGTAA